MVPDLGSRVGPYRVIRRLGSGGMGTVLLAEDTRLRRPVALKTISDADNVTPEARQSLLHEARAAAALSHPHIAAVHDVLDADGQIVIVFEYVDGDTLAATLSRGPLALARAVEIALELADALDAAHGHSIVHRDLKPANIILSPQGRAVVLDFGIARLLPAADETTTFGDPGSAAGGLIGTPGYAAPEQWAGQHADARSDLYSLGVVLFEMVAGRRPFEERDAMALGQAVALRKAPRLSSVVHVPHELDALVAALLARGPSERPQSAREVIPVLRQIRRGLDATATGRTPVPAWERKTRTRRAAVAAALLGALVIAAVAVAYRGGPPVTDETARPPVIAVLPLTALSDGGAQDYLSAGMAESLIARLAAVPSITVLSRAAVADARAAQPNLRQLVRDLDAAYLVETGVQQSGEQLRITLNLVRRDGSVVWADTFDGAFTGIFDLQSRMASALSQALHVRLSDAQQRQFEEQPTSIPDALAAYWRGRAMLERRDVAGNVETAIDEFERAIALDGRYALAYAALGEAYWAQYGRTREAQWVQRATDAGMSALRLAPDQAAVRYSMALTLAGSGRLDDAADELQRALALRPNFDDARQQLGAVFARQGRIDEAVAEFDRAIALRPGYARHHFVKATYLLLAARYREAVTAFEVATTLQPDNYMGYLNLGVVHSNLGEHDAALSYYERANQLQPSGQAYSNIGAIHHRRGEYDLAVEAYLKAIGLRPNAHTTHRNLGDAYLRSGRVGPAREAYRVAVQLVRDELAINPTDPDRLSSLAVYHQKAGEPEEAMAALRRAEAQAPDDVNVLFRAGVVHALAGRPDAALTALLSAVDRGFSRTRIAEDDDLATLRPLPAFAAVIDEAR
ncbi:MAG: tetratricopeptide repeat protein [Vicinamibacterales bacterium]|nr:tetratricopeptide repeat protein [Vicinamibacterales bacterium]